MNEEIINSIMEQTGLSQKEIISYVGEKKDDFPGITEFGALFLLCKELCIESEGSII